MRFLTLALLLTACSPDLKPELDAEVAYALHMAPRENSCYAMIALRPGMFAQEIAKRVKVELRDGETITARYALAKAACETL